MVAPRVGRILSLILAVSILAVIMLINTNSRSSILIKEICAVSSSIALMAVSGIFLLAGAHFSTSRVSRAMLLILLALFAWIVARHFTGVHSVNGPMIIYYFMALTGLVLAMTMFFDRNDRDLLLWVLLGGTFMLCAYALTQSMGVTLFRWDAGLILEARSSGSLGNPNLLGSFAAAMIPVGSAFLYSRERLGRMRLPLAGLFALLCIGALIASETRGSLIGVAALLILVPILPSIRRTGLKRVAMLMLAILIILGMAGFLLRNRIAEITASSDEVSTTGVRRLIWSGAIAMIEDKPVTGWGPGSFQIIFPQYRDPTYNLQGVQHNTLQVHCEYLEILSDLGFVGLFLWGSLALTTAARVRRLPGISSAAGGRSDQAPDQMPDDTAPVDWTAIGLIGGIVSLLAEASVSVALRWPPSAFLLALLVGLLLTSIPPSMKPGRPLRRVITAVPLLSIAAFLSIQALPEYSNALISGRLLFMGKDYYLDQVETKIVQAMDAATNWVSTGAPEARQAALDLFDEAMAASDSSIKLSIRCTEVNPRELGGWYSLGSGYLTRAMLLRPVSRPMISVLESFGRSPYDYDEAARYIQLGLESYDSLMVRAPNYAEIHNNLALAWTNAGDVDRAIGAIRNAYRFYAQTRSQYRRQLELMTTIATTPDAIHMIWVTSLEYSDSELEEEMADPRFANILRTIFFRSGTCMLYDPEAADSMAVSFAAVADSMVPQLSATLAEGVSYQAAQIPAGLELRDRFLSGETTGLLEDLSGYTEDQIMMLPMQAAIKGCLLAAAGDPEGMELLTLITGTLAIDCTGRLTSWPLGMETFRAMADALEASGLDQTGERDHFDMFVSVCLNLDWNLFRVGELMSTSPGFESNVSRSIQSAIDSAWAEIGGPLYCVRHAELLTDGTARLPFIAAGSVLDRCMTGLDSLSAASPMDAELIKERIYFFYTIYLAFYLNTPAFTEEQSLGALDSLRSARNELTVLLGEEESRYQLNAMFNRVSFGEQMLQNSIYYQLMETLRTDIVGGELPEM